MSHVRLSGHQRLALAAAIKADIDAYCANKYDDGYRAHLGGSVIGERCLRRLWYSFRWMHREQFDGRMQRLFNRGHLEEIRIIEWLRGIGSEVFDVTEDGKQYRITGSSGHFGGSLDGIMRLPERYNLPIAFLTEFKTHNDKSFQKLKKVGVQQAKPMHYNQMCTYGADAMYGFEYGIYFAMNKNDDELFIEVVELDHNVGKRNVAKADSIIKSETAPGRISASAAYSDCVYCPMNGICHRGEPIDKNCRSCAYATPIDDGEWRCRKYELTIPREHIKAGCQEWEGLQH